MSLFDIVLLILVGIVSIPVGIFCLEVLLAILPRPASFRASSAASFGTGGTTGRMAVLVPAHDEQAVLEATLNTLIPTLPAGGRVLVIADNCTDATAAIARRCGVEVVDRLDPNRRGKGFALDCGIRHLEADPPEAIVFLDADCRVESDTVGRLSEAAIRTGRPTQGLNLCDPDPRGGAQQMVTGLAFRFKNLVRAMGLARLAGVCHLTGTGMALPWSLARQARLADNNVVEDLQLGIELTLAGHPPLFLPEARVSSPLPQTVPAARTQRQRWEHGHMRTLLVQTPRLLWLGLRYRRQSLLWLALDLAVPPLSLLVLILCAATAGMLTAYLFGASWVPLAAMLAVDAALVLAVVLGWAVYCQGQIPLKFLTAAPLYVIAKLPIYAAFVGRRQVRWIRTERDAPPAAKVP